MPIFFTKRSFNKGGVNTPQMPLTVKFLPHGGIVNFEFFHRIFLEYSIPLCITSSCVEALDVPEFEKVGFNNGGKLP